MNTNEQTGGEPGPDEVEDQVQGDDGESGDGEGDAGDEGEGDGDDD